MGLSLEGFGGEFEIGKIAFELEDLKKGREIEERKVDLFFSSLVWEGDANIRRFWKRKRRRARITGLGKKKGERRREQAKRGFLFGNCLQKEEER